MQKERNRIDMFKMLQYDEADLIKVLFANMLYIKAI